MTRLLHSWIASITLLSLVGTAGISAARAAQSTQAAAPVEPRAHADPETAGDSLKASPAVEAPARHRARSLNGQREVAENSPANPPSAAGASTPPVLADALVAAMAFRTGTDPSSAPNDVGGKHESRSLPANPRPTWGMYRSEESVEAPLRPEVVDVHTPPTSSNVPLERTWGMYGAPTPASAIRSQGRSQPGDPSVQPSATPDRPTAPHAPFFVYRDPNPGTATP